MLGIIIIIIRYYNTRNKRTFHSRDIRTVHFGSKTLSYLAPKIWELVPKEIKIKNLLPPLKMGLKNGNQQIALATYAKHIFQVGFV